MLQNIIHDSILHAQNYISSQNHLKVDLGSQIIFMDKNENRLGCSPKVIEVLKQSLLNNISDYPDDSCIYLKEKLADHFKLDTASILITNGSIEALNLIFKTFKINNIIIPSPTYWAYEAFARIHNRNILKVPLEKDFSFDIYKLIDITKKDDKSCVILCNPNNPTGKLISNEEIAILLESLKDSLIVIDEAYAEFARTTSASLTKKYDNLIVIKSFSKSYGLAGLRIGYAVASKEIIKYISYSRIPFSVNSIAQIAARTAFDDQDYHTYVVDCNEKNRKILHTGLMTFKFLNPVPSKTNFILTKLENVRPVELFNFLLNNKVVIRLLGQDSRLSDFIRISVGTEKDNQFLISLMSRFQNQFSTQNIKN